MKEITFSNKHLKFEIPEGGFKEGQKILFMGHLKGMTGGYEFDEEFNDLVFRPKESNVKVDVFRNNLEFFKAIIEAKAHLYVLSNSGTIKHFWSLMKNEMYRFFQSEFKTKEEYITYIKRNGIMYEIQRPLNCKARTFEECTGLSMKKVLKQKDMKFDYIIQNPPYNGSLHLDFLEKGLDLLTEKGRMVIIEPATWLINVRKNGKAKKYDDIKKRIERHVESVKIENFNKDFGTGLYVPFAITTIDFSKTFDEIEFTCCGEKKVVKSIYDCNLVGEYETIWGILVKCQKFGDMMKNHITNESMGEGVCYSKYDEILPCGIEPAEKNSKLGRSGVYGRDTNYINVLSSEYLYTYIQSVFNRFVPISDTIMKTLKGGSDYKNPKYSDKNADCIYGTRQELENWKHFIFNNKLPLFLNIVLTIDQHNCSKEFLPWLVDKQYTDEEINEMFGFTDEEIALIDRTIKKYERNSPWFKRYMCGPDAATDEEVNNFINSL